MLKGDFMIIKVNIVGLETIEVEKGIKLLALSQKVFGEDYKK